MKALDFTPQEVQEWTDLRLIAAALATHAAVVGTVNPESPLLERLRELQARVDDGVLRLPLANFRQSEAHNGAVPVRLSVSGLSGNRGEAPWSILLEMQVPDGYEAAGVEIASAKIEYSDSRIKVYAWDSEAPFDDPVVCRTLVEDVAAAIRAIRDEAAAESAAQEELCTTLTS